MRLSKLFFPCVLISCLLLSLLASAAEDPNSKLVKAARTEGKVVIYSYSTRPATSKKTFEAKYPGITVEFSNMKAYDVIEKIGREFDSNLNKCDMILTSDADGTIVNDLLPRGVIKNYVPSELQNVMLKQNKSPLLVQFIQVETVFYNSKVFPEAPVNSWWDLTRPEWKGKVIMNDPLSMSETLGTMIAIINHSSDMAASYKKEFGTALKVKKGETAGHEFIRRLLANDPVFMPSSDDVIEALGQGTQEVVGISVTPKLRNVIMKNYPLKVAWKMEPALGVSSKAYLVMLRKAPHPNATKLFIKWMMGDNKAGEGYEPFFVPGSFAGRFDVPPPPSTPATSELKIWSEDPAFTWQNGLKVRDFWMLTKKASSKN